MAFQPQHELQLTIACQADHWTMYLSGDLVDPQCRDIVDIAGVLAASRVPHLTVDLGAVTSVDSGGYQSIRDATAVIESGGGTVRVLHLSPARNAPGWTLQPVGG